MAYRLLILIVPLVAIALLAWQNFTPAVPLRFLGLQTGAYPLAVWLVGAIALGALSAVFLNELMGLGGSSSSKRRSPSRYGRRIPYDPATAAASEPRTAPPPRREPEPRPEPQADGEWSEWTNLRSPSQWEDWSGRTAPSDRPAGGAAGGPNPAPWWGRKRSEAQAQQVSESWQEISDGWDDLENRRYRARGVSPVEDALDDLDEGWEDNSGNPSGKRVYRDGSIYSQPEPPRGRTDNVYGPPDRNADDWEPPQDRRGLEWDAPDYSDNEDSEDLDDPEVGPDGVVDADFRVIIPPYRPLDSPISEDDDDDDWVDGTPER